MQATYHELIGQKNIDLYLAASSSIMCKISTPVLTETYKELATKGDDDFEIILISLDEDEKSLQELHFHIPITQTSGRLKSLFSVESTPGPIILNEKGIVVNSRGLLVVYKYSSNGYPFTKKELSILKMK